MLRDGNDIYLDKRMRVAEKHAIVEGVGETSLSSNRLGDDMHNLPYGLSSDHVSSRYRTQDMALSGVPAVDGAVPVEDTTQQTGILENKQYPDSSNPRPQQLEEMQIGIEQQPPPVQSEAVQGSVPFAKGHVGDHWWQLYHGDCRTILPDLPKQSVHCVVTSPPYYCIVDPGIWTVKGDVYRW